MKILEFSAYKKDKDEKPPFDEFYEQYYYKVLNYLKNKLNGVSDAEELTSEIFLYSYEHYSSYDPEKSSLSTWIFLIANSRLKNFFRDRRQDTDLSALEAYLYEEPDMERAMYITQLRETLASAIKQLPQKQQDALIMRYYQDKSFEEIAVSLETTQGNVRVMISRAIDRLGVIFGPIRDQLE